MAMAHLRCVHLLQLWLWVVGAHHGDDVGQDASDASNDLVLRKLPGAVASHHARCLDGSPPGYYHRFNKTSADWLIILMGVSYSSHGVTGCVWGTPLCI